jgi:RNA polymerase sigma-70 factor (ECF subfamily)
MQSLDPHFLLQNSGWIRSLAVRLVGSEDQAEDVVQETWIAAAKGLPQDAESSRPWLARVVRNLAARVHRDDRRRYERERRAARPELASGHPAETLERAEALHRVVELVLELDEPYRSTVLHRFVDDLTPSEIAARASLPVATVKTRLSRALNTLRERLDLVHGGRAAWLGLFGTLFMSGTAEAARGTAIAGLATPVLATGTTSAGSSSSTLITLGGIVMGWKIAIGAGVASVVALVLGVGLGRMTSITSREEAKTAFGLVDSEALARAERERQELATELAKLDAAEKSKSRRVAELEAEIGTVRKSLADAATELAAKSEPTGSKLPAIAFGEFSELEGLHDVNWTEAAEALVNMRALVAEASAREKDGDPLPQNEFRARLMKENGKLVQLAGKVIGTIPTHSPVNGEFTHPLIVSNLANSVLDAAGLSLDERQRQAVASLGGEYERKYAELQATYGDETPHFVKFLDELELKQDFVERLGDGMTEEQRRAAFDFESTGTVLDVLSPMVSTQAILNPKQVADAGEARRVLLEALTKRLELSEDSAGQLGPAIEAWSTEMSPYLEPVAEGEMPKIDRMLAAGRAHRGLFEAIEGLEGIPAATLDRARAELSWFVPWVTGTPK